MTLVSIDTPIKTVSTIQSRIISASQVRYTYTRKDGTFTTVSKTAGNKLIIDNYTLYGPSSVGDRIYVKFDDDTVNAEGVITVKNSSPNTIETDIDYSDTATAKNGFANNFDAIPNYRVKVTISQFPDFDLYVTSGAEGLVTIELGRTIRQLIRNEGEREEQITISTQEIWDGGSNSASAETQIMVTDSIRGIKASNGANLWDYLLQSPAPGKLLTKFPNEELIIWDGWRRLINTILDPDISTRFPTNNIEWNFRNYDENKANISLIQTNTISKTPFRIAGRVVPVGTSYYTGGWVREDITNIQISEIYLFEIRDECRKPIMIEWVNSLGAFEQHLFSYDQTVTTRAKDGVLYNLPFNDDIENITETKGRLTDGFTQTITLQAAELTRGQVQALNEIKYSREVRLFLKKDGTEYVNVAVYAGYGDDISTKAQKHEFYLSIVLPDNFDLFDNLTYEL
jgi:hypothetical protein